MSIRVINIVIDRFPGHPTEFSIMMVLANFGNDEGKNIYPAIETVAKKCNISRDQAKRLLKKLEKEQWIRFVSNLRGGPQGNTKHYEIAIEKLMLYPIKQ